MRVITSRFGDLEIPEECIIDFPKGLYGFESHNKYCIVNVSPDSPFRWMQSLSEPALAVVVATPFSFFPDYDIEIADEDIREISQGSKTEPEILCIVTVGQGASSVTMNLKAPLVVNPDTRSGKQVILLDSTYDTRVPLPMAKEEQG